MRKLYFTKFVGCVKILTNKNKRSKPSVILLNNQFDFLSGGNKNGENLPDC